MTEGKTTPEFEQLLEHLKQSRGFDFTAYKRSTLARRIDKRMASVSVASYEDYLDFLEVHPDEFGQLFNAILINVTSFFRDPETFEYLRTEVIPALLGSKNPTEQIRVWSAGCASGEECCSVAIMLAEILGADQFRERVKIYATDIDEEELAVARAAAYSDRDMEDVPPDLRTKYFDHDGSRSVFKKDFRRSVIFGRHDLLDDAPISRVDLLVCRNTLMYFNSDAQSRVLSRFHVALREGGYLVLGKAEMLLNFAGTFTPVDLKQRVFVKVRSEDGADRLLPGYPPGREERPAPASSSNRLREIAFDQDPVAQFVVDARTQLLLANARARELFGLTPRDIGRPLQDLEASYRPVELRSCIDDAHARRQVVQLRDVAWPQLTGEARFFDVQVTPIVDADTTLGSQIIFTDVTRQHELRDEFQRSRHELETTNEALQSTNARLETTNEVLQSTNARLETTNEALQSTNARLETTSEELQSTNAGLETTNEQLQSTNAGLETTNEQLQSTNAGLETTNEQLQSTNAGLKTTNEQLQSTNAGLETTNEQLQSTNAGLETTNEQLQSTNAGLETTNEQLQSTNAGLKTTNEQLRSTNEELETVNQELLQRGADLGRSNVFLSGILRSVPLGVVVVNEELHVELWNDVAADLWGLRHDEVHGKHFFGLDIGLPVEQLRQPILALLQSPDRTAELHLDATNRRGRHISLRVSVANVGGAPDQGRGIILLMQEVDVAVH